MNEDAKVFSANLEYDDFLELEKAIYTMEKPSFFIKVSNLLGSPIEKLLDKLPESNRDKIIDITNDALLKATNLALNLWNMLNQI
jgi:hypothetical protein